MRLSRGERLQSGRENKSQTEKERGHSGGEGVAGTDTVGQLTTKLAPCHSATRSRFLALHYLLVGYWCRQVL